VRRQHWVNGGLLALALGTLGVVWATRESPTTTDLAQRKDKLWPAFRREDVERVVLRREGQELELRREGGELRIARPWAERADVATAQRLLSGLELASALRPADGVDAASAGLGEGAFSIRVEGGPKPQVLRLGGQAPAPSGARYAEVEQDGARRVYVVSQGVAAELDVPFERFRETRLLELGRSELAAITITSGAQHLELEQREHGAFFVRVDGAWQLARREAIDAILDALSRLSSEQLVEADAARSALGADAREVTLRAFDQGAPPLTLRFGARCPSAAEQAVVLREQAGRAPRAGCIPSEVARALAVSVADATLYGPFSARVDEVEELRVTRGADKLELARKDKAFVLRGPSPSDVPLDAGNERISAILRARGTPSAVPFEPRGELTIQISGADEATHREEKVSVSAPRLDGAVCLKRAADGVGLCFDAEVARSFEPDGALLRSLSVFRFAPSELALLRVEAPGSLQRLARRDDGSYELLEPRGFSHDGALVANLVQTLGSLEAARWVAGHDEPRFGLAAPRLRVTVTLTGGLKERELVVGAPAPGGYFARLSPDPGVFVLPGLAFTDLGALLIDRSLSPFAEADLARAEVKAGKGRAKPLGGELLKSAASLRAEQAVHLGPSRPSEGLEAPQLQLSLTDRGGKTIKVSVGACDTLNDAAVCYARREGVDATFALSRRLVAELRDFAEDAP
jgi:Domain of unknown function (DUF4340)